MKTFWSSRSITYTKVAGRIVVVINLSLLTLSSVKTTPLGRLLKKCKEFGRTWCLPLTTSTSFNIFTNVGPIAILVYTQATSQTNIRMNIYLYYCTPLLYLRQVTRYSDLFPVILTFCGFRWNHRHIILNFSASQCPRMGWNY